MTSRFALTFSLVVFGDEGALAKSTLLKTLLSCLLLLCSNVAFVCSWVRLWSVYGLVSRVTVLRCWFILFR